MTRSTFVRSGWKRFVTLTFLLIPACTDRDPIRHYTVERPGPEHRMLAAIVPRPNLTWFFKVTGPNALLAERSGEFEQFLKSIRFADGQPTWELPEGWQQRPGDQFRYATLEMASEGPPLELTVSRLGTPSGDLAGYVLSNVNRWRGQMQLPPLTIDQLEAQTSQLTIDEEFDLKATLVELEGSLSASPPAASMAGAARPGGPAAGAGPARPPAQQADISYTQPAGWREGERVRSRGGMRIEREAAFVVVDGEESAEITVTSLPAAAGQRLPNVNRWRSQVQLPPIASGDLALEPIPFGHVTGDYVEIIGPSKAVLGVIAEHGGVAWFAKLEGPHALAVRERERFKEFVRSIEFQE